MNIFFLKWECVSMEVYFSNLSPLVSPSGAEGEVKPAAGRHLQWCRCMCQIYLQAWVDVVLLQRIQAEHPLHDPLRRCGVCRSPGEAEQKSKIKCCVHLKDTVFHYASYCSQSWAGQRGIQPTTVTPNCFSSLLWPSLLDKWPVTHWQW